MMLGRQAVNSLAVVSQSLTGSIDRSIDQSIINQSVVSSLLGSYAVVASHYLEGQRQRGNNSAGCNGLTEIDGHENAAHENDGMARSCRRTNRVLTEITLQ